MINSFKILSSYFLIAILLIMFGCNSAKQAQKHYDIAKRKNIITLAENVHKDFPCLTNTDTITIDSIVVKEKVVEQNVPYYIHDTLTGRIDTILLQAKCKCKDSIVYSTRTIKVLDSAFILLAKEQVERVKATALEQLNKVEQGRNIWRVLALVFMGMAALVLFFIIRKIF